MNIKLTFINKIINIIQNQTYAISLYMRQLAGTLVLLLIARYLSVDDYGLFSSYKNIAGFCLLFTNLDFDQYILVSSKANTHEVKPKVSLLILNALFLIIFVTLGSLFFNIENHILFFLILLRTFFDGTFFAIMLPFFQASNKFLTIAKINIGYGICNSLIAIISYILKLSLVKFLILSISVGLINYLQCIYFSKINIISPLIYLKRFIKKIDKRVLTYIASSVTSYLYAQTSALYVAVFLPKQQAALFFAAYTIAMFPTLFTAAKVQKMLPELIKKSPTEHQLIIRTNVLLVTSIFIGVIIFFIFFGKQLLTLIYVKDYYMNAHIILILLMIANTFMGISTIYGAHITANGHQKKKVTVKIEASVITILSLLLLHKYGIVGAAVSVTISGFYTALRYGLHSGKMIKKTNRR